MMDALRNQIIERRVLDLIKRSAKFKDVKMPANQARGVGR